LALLNTRDCGATRPEGEVDANLSVVDRAIMAVADATGATTLDLRAHFCSEGVCRTNRGNYWMFRDGYHITVAESAALAPTFAGSLRRAAEET
jgi:hypothetical protein